MWIERSVEGRVEAMAGSAPGKIGATLEIERRGLGDRVALARGRALVQGRDQGRNRARVRGSVKLHMRGAEPAMIYGLGWPNWGRLGVWLLAGFVIYFSHVHRERPQSLLPARCPPARVLPRQRSRS